mmetsp:Transcript_33581/g.60226  ORF Transcript_33581/g.60226 Transcript_33581/m.60226 type:complete len:114 (-) Transcript_33581:2220-2561(-)
MVNLMDVYPWCGYRLNHSGGGAADRDGVLGERRIHNSRRWHWSVIWLVELIEESHHCFLGFSPHVSSSMKVDIYALLGLGAGAFVMETLGIVLHTLTFERRQFQPQAMWPFRV